MRQQQKTSLLFLAVVVSIISASVVGAFQSLSSSSRRFNIQNSRRKSSSRLSGSLKASTLRTSSETSSSASTTTSSNNNNKNENTAIDDLSAKPNGEEPILNTDELKYNDNNKNNKQKNEYDLMCGKAIDTLKKDYPIILTENPDYSIYHDQLMTIDPSGVTLHGIKSYKNSFRFLHAIINLFYCPERSLINSRLCYDMARKSIRVSWNAEIVPKLIFGGTKTTLHVDGISVYELHPASGLITQHKIDHLVINNSPVRPTEGVFNAMQSIVADNRGGGVVPPVLNIIQQQQDINNKLIDTIIKAQTEKNKNGNNNDSSSSPHILQFSMNNNMNPFKRQQSSLFTSNENTIGKTVESSVGGGGSGNNDDIMNTNFDYEAYHKKNESRKKFGLKPITPQEFEQIQLQVQDLNTKQQQKAIEQQQLAAAQQAAAEEEANKKNNIFSKIMNSVKQKDTCETNYDCERPEVCCDFGFIKKCCTSGMRIVDGLSPVPGMRTVPIPVETGNGGGDIGSGYPDGRGPMA